MTENKPTDYAALIRAAQNPVPQPPEWLSVGSSVYSPERGIGEVMALLGKRLIVKFLEDVEPTQFENWEEATARGAIDRGNVATPEKNNSADVRVISEQIQQIPHLGFQAIATELATAIATVDITQPCNGSQIPLPDDLPSQLRDSLEQNGISHLYSHQIEALSKLRAGFDLSITTPTASGKSLCYNLAILESCIKQPQTTALYIFPLKALALDQMGKLQSLTRGMPSKYVKIGLITGDTPKEERIRTFIPTPPNILAVSPDLLHHFLYTLRRRDDGEGWRQFLCCLRWVVIDESHTYLGAFGAHFANLMRRLSLAVDAVGGNSRKLQFICSSATIGNPKEMALRLLGRERQPQRLHLIENSGSSSAGRTLLSLLPSNASGFDAAKIVIYWLQHDLSGIVFCNSRAAVKSLLGIIQREAQRSGNGYLASKVAVFYSSLTSDRRKEILYKLQTGQIKVILSTSSLEAGIDIPELDCCLIKGFPGSKMSFWQRVGRAGRKQHGLVIFLPVAQNPIDAFYAQRPEQLLSKEVESAAFNPDYPTILGKHLECGCTESGLLVGEVNQRFGNIAGSVADSLMQQNRLFISNSGRMWGQGYPHKEVNLRGGTQTSISLIDQHTREILETMSLPQAHREVFTDAIYTLQDSNGDMVDYQCLSLDSEKGEAILEALDRDNNLYTEPETDLNIQPLSPLAEHKIITTSIEDGRLRLSLVWGEITSSVTGYRLMKRFHGKTCINKSCTNHQKPLEGINCSLCSGRLRYREITKLQTEVQFQKPYVTKYQAPCVMVEINKPLQQALAEYVNELKKEIIKLDGSEIPQQFLSIWKSLPTFTVLHSIQHQIVKAVPLVVLSSSLDVDGIVDEKDGRVIGYFFDTCDGGNGASEAIFHDLPKFADSAIALASECDCETGCPRCLHDSGCPQHNAGLYKDAGLFLLKAIGF